MIEVNQITQAIKSAIKGAEVRIMNPQKDGLHFDAIVISPIFMGKNLVEQHQMVMNPLKELFDSKLHALSLKTYTPEEWDEVKR
ncbi:MAG: BolA/IbaG family iron-sulfur metabolism protein [Candidatus Neptunochlamydia sp.]|nr:BolA/IbaG family iron-sulfur metabolism protein [Candidatus Neptunochlamydia sp.]